MLFNLLFANDMQSNSPINGHVDKALYTWIVEHFFLYWVRIKHGVKSEFSTLSFAIDLLKNAIIYNIQAFQTSQNLDKSIYN